MDPPSCPSRVLGGPNPEQMYSGEVSKAGRVAVDMMREVKRETRKGAHHGAQGKGKKAI